RGSGDGGRFRGPPGRVPLPPARAEPRGEGARRAHLHGAPPAVHRAAVPPRRGRERPAAADAAAAGGLLASMTALLVLAIFVVPWAAAGALALNRRARQRLRVRLVRAARRHLSDEGEAPEVETIEPFPLVAFLLQRLGLQERVERHLRRMD